MGKQTHTMSSSDWTCQSEMHVTNDSGNYTQAAASRLALAFPMGCTKSLSMTASDTGNDSPYRISFSRNTTGSGSLMAAFSKPLASSASYGAMTCSVQSS